ncbi:hypothetical protein [Acinetobacter sp. FDAARGOS_541]|uniref:hypothetical protein n=1 Tax=Acinetobacter sp. FDAARGOS_541 TaxID=2420312 RepID=UPI001E3AD051|nr:hypothetical protein [Acinetobacter sp. FDAARGOS_541]
MFHSVGDGKGRRRIYVNGNLINHVIWANEEKGLICYMPYPFKVNKKKIEFIRGFCVAMCEWR